MDREEYDRQLALHGLKYERPRPSLITLPKDHPLYCMTHKGRAAEARVIMAEHLGRPLSRNEIVCYKDNFPLNTNIDNLELKDRQYFWDTVIEWGSEYDTDNLESYQIGKKEEERVASYLSKLGYYVIDISRTRHYKSDGTFVYSPFDIYAWTEKYSFLADVKYRSSGGDIYFNSSILELYSTYWNHIQVTSRLVIIAGSSGDLVIDTSDIHPDLDNHCIVERWKAKPTTVLRTRMEGQADAPNTRLRYLHIEPCSDIPSGYKILGVFPYPQTKVDKR